MGGSRGGGVTRSQQGALERRNGPPPVLEGAAGRVNCKSSERRCGTCRIRSPSRMRPSLAAMLFGLICEGRQDTVRPHGSKKTSTESVLTRHSDPTQVRQLDGRNPLFLPTAPLLRSIATESLRQLFLAPPTLNGKLQLTKLKLYVAVAFWEVV